MEAYTAVEQALPPVQAGMDSENMKLVSQALAAGLYRDPWERDKGNDKKDKVYALWLGDAVPSLAAQDLPSSISNLSDARVVLLAAVSAVDVRPQRLLTQAIRAFATSSAGERSALKNACIQPNMTEIKFNKRVLLLNGSWDLAVSLRDISSHCATHGTNAWRRTVDVDQHSAVDDVLSLSGMISTQTMRRIWVGDETQQSVSIYDSPTVQVRRHYGTTG
jgi:hypothetical protein